MARNKVALPSTAYPVDFKKAVNIFADQYILKALRQYKGNVSRTAEEIGTTRRTIQNYLARQSLTSQQVREALPKRRRRPSIVLSVSRKGRSLKRRQHKSF